MRQQPLGSASPTPTASAIQGVWGARPNARTQSTMLQSVLCIALLGASAARVCRVPQSGRVGRGSIRCVVVCQASVVPSQCAVKTPVTPLATTTTITSALIDLVPAGGMEAVLCSPPPLLTKAAIPAVLPQTVAAPVPPGALATDAAVKADAVPGMLRGLAARFVGGVRCATSGHIARRRAARTAASRVGRTARRSTGARLQAGQYEHATPLPLAFDLSRLRAQIQLGLRVNSGVCRACSREFKTLSASETSCAEASGLVSTISKMYIQMTHQRDSMMKCSGGTCCS